MKRLFDPFFLSYCGLWSIIHFFRYIEHPVPLLNGHLTDFMAVPAIAHLALTFTRSYIVRDESYSYPFSYLLFIVLYLSVVFEWVMPQFSAAYTGDMWDVVMYFGGGLFYYYVHEKRITLKGKMPS
ncbi:hypothetical protein AB6805_11185 [Chitinophaga sp. RCC_12]|uniref:hypothetical protein n=1 Tax=Chitinophaga sp. RCC_12 TaxID=3239226 RepID=UPI003524452A